MTKADLVEKVTDSLDVPGVVGFALDQYELAGWAAKAGRQAMVEFLLSRGARPNLPDDPPWATPLAWATRNGRADIVELLKQHGAT